MAMVHPRVSPLRSTRLTFQRPAAYLAGRNAHIIAVRHNSFTQIKGNNLSGIGIQHATEAILTGGAGVAAVAYSIHRFRKGIVWLNSIFWILSASCCVALLVNYIIDLWWKGK